MYPKNTEVQINQKKEWKNAFQTAINFTFISLSATTARKNNMENEETPNQLSMKISDKNAPITEVQFWTVPLIDRDSRKFILSKMLLSAAPVKKYDKNDKNRYTIIAERKKPRIKCVFSSLINENMCETTPGSFDFLLPTVEGRSYEGFLIGFLGAISININVRLISFV